jgi:AcrR family transcriptional regulator
MTKDERRRQLLDAALDLVRTEGTDALTLARVAERAGVTKPIAYEHFGTKAGLLAALYRDYDDRQRELMRHALEAEAASLADAAGVVARAYVGCAVSAGPEIAAISAALSGSAELEEVRKSCQDAFMEECRRAFAPYMRAPDAPGPADLLALLGAADGLSGAAATGRITSGEAVATLSRLAVCLLQDG